jgi:hypothetical protein
MDDFGNIIYIVLTLILLVGSALRKKKKPNQQRQVKKRVTESVFDDIFGVDSESAEQDIFESISANRVHTFESATEPPVIKEEPLTKKYPETKTGNISTFDFDLEEEEEEKYRDSDSFDLKDAVIKSIILERKHF